MEKDENYEFYNIETRWYIKARTRKQQEVKKGANMEIQKTAMAGTLESSDAQITVEPSDSLSLSIESSVMNQYGRQIKAIVLKTLDELEVKNAKVTVVDKGALECTLKARVECAVYRSSGVSDKNIAWGGNVR